MPGFDGTGPSGQGPMTGMVCLMAAEWIRGFVEVLAEAEAGAVVVVVAADLGLGGSYISI